MDDEHVARGTPGSSSEHFVSKSVTTTPSIAASEHQHPVAASKSVTMAASEHRSPGKKKKKRRRKPKDAFDIFSIPGVVKIVLSELAQKIIGCVAGVDVTTENPWTWVDKELVQDNLELHEESSEFLPIRKEVLNYPRPKLLIGYIPDESNDYDEFFICITENAADDVTAIIEKKKKQQEERLNNAINKTIKEWVSQGTEAEVDESIMKNNRPLIEVELETKYPIFPDKVQFRLVRAQQRRDGYVELRSTEETFANVYRRRIDAGVQVAPRCISTEAQTNCTYPSNSSTQYVYELENTDQLLEKCSKSIVKYTNENMENIADILTVNGVMNLYSDDYSSLTVDPDGLWAQTQSASDDIKEYMSFMDVNLCKGKKIASVMWHPMWTGTIAIAYADIAANDYLNGPNTEDTVTKAVYGVNPVLLWSISDALKPKLILESPREVLTISFCLFDENILIGGCKDGQIIIWDIRNKLNKVEELEVLTPAQQRYRNHMNSLMGWMKNVHDLALVRPTAISDPRYSHKGPVTGIMWMNPFHEFSKIGNLTEVPEDSDTTSMQFMTCSDDGTVLIWDLLKKPKVEPGGFKVKKLKRLKKKPSALMVDVSPYQTLHLNLKPLYKVYLRKPGEKTKNLAISSCYANQCHGLTYVERTPPSKRFNPQERVYYSPVLKRDPSAHVSSTIQIGTMEGDFAVLKWDGQDFDSGEVVNSETGVTLSFGKYHDGPVNSVHGSNYYKLFLTAGGRIFALWRNDFRDRPVLWRRCRSKLTSAKFNMYQPYMFTTLLMSGHVENWQLASNSKHPVRSYMYSSQYITASSVHPLKLKKTIYGAGDTQGAFRLFVLGETKDSLGTKLSAFVAFVDREVERKKEFIAWQEEWNKRHEGLLKLKEDQLQQRRDKEEEERKRRAAEIFHEKPPEKPLAKGPQPGKFVEWMIEQRQVEREAMIKAMIINKKQLDTKELEKRRKPLQKLEEENEMKKRKQKQRLKEGDAIFHNTVAALFPEVVKEKPAPPPDPYAGGDMFEEMYDCYEEYDKISDQADNFIYDNPYDYEFDWRQVLDGGKARRRLLDDAGTSFHRSYTELRSRRRRVENRQTETFGKQVEEVEERAYEQGGADTTVKVL